jgi:hypothetical protein
LVVEEEEEEEEEEEVGDEAHSGVVAQGHYEGEMFGCFYLSVSTLS